MPVSVHNSSSHDQTDLDPPQAAIRNSLALVQLQPVQTNSDDVIEETPSPRTELLSESTTTRTGTPNSRHHRSTDPPSPLETKRQARTHTQSQSQNHKSDKRKKDRERDILRANNTHRELVRLLIDQEHETAKLRQTLYATIQRLEEETQRITTLESENAETVDRFRAIENARAAAQNEANENAQKARIANFQLESADKEINNLQEALKDMEKQRDEAEAVAARARERARKFKGERVVATAREEARRYGFEAGFQQAQIETVMRLQASGDVPPSGGHAVSRQPTAGPSAPRPSHPSTNANVNPNAATRNTADDGRESDGRSSSFQELDSIPIISPPESTILPPGATKGPIRGAKPPLQQKQQQQQQKPPPPPPASVPDIQTPAVVNYNISIPSTESFHNNGPWVTGQQHRDINGHTPSTTAMVMSAKPGEPPISLYTGTPTDIQRRLQQQQQQQPQQKKSVKFPPSTFRRPSLAKTATSWYRSLSFRKKNKEKPLIDPIDEEEETGNGNNDPPSTATPSQSQSQGNVGQSSASIMAPSIQTQGSKVPLQPQPGSTQQPNQNPSLSKPGSSLTIGPPRSSRHSKSASLPNNNIHTQMDPAFLMPGTRHGHGLGSTHSGSSRTSQIDLLSQPNHSNPNPNPNARQGPTIPTGVPGQGSGMGRPMSVSGRSVQSNGAFSTATTTRKKLSVIDENPGSRGITPIKKIRGNGSVTLLGVGGSNSHGRGDDGRSVRSTSSRMVVLNPDPESPDSQPIPVYGRPPSTSALMKPATASNASLLTVPVPGFNPVPLGGSPGDTMSVVNTPTPLPKNHTEKPPTMLNRNSATIGINVQSPSQSSGAAQSALVTPSQPYSGAYLSPNDVVYTPDTQVHYVSAHVPSSRPHPTANTADISYTGSFPPRSISPISRATPKIFQAQSLQKRSFSDDPSLLSVGVGGNLNNFKNGNGNGTTQNHNGNNKYLSSNAGMTPGISQLKLNNFGDRLTVKRLHRTDSASSLRSQGSYGKFDADGYEDPAIWGAPYGAFGTGMSNARSSVESHRLSYA